jgi:hypothetical protein
MQIYYALYDQSYSTSEGNDHYWTWYAPEIRPLLIRFYLDVAAKHLPPKPNDLLSDDLWGGLVRLADWTVVYRYFDGGCTREQPPRPQRCVLLTAWIPADEAQGVDLLPIFTNETFQEAAENARKIPVPPPFALQEEWEAKRIFTIPFQEGETSFTDLAQAVRVFAGIPAHRKTRFMIADVKMIKTAEEQKFVLDVVPEPKPEPPIPEPQEEPLKPEPSEDNGPTTSESERSSLGWLSRVRRRAMAMAIIGTLILGGVVLYVMVYCPPSPNDETQKHEEVPPAESAMDKIFKAIAQLSSEDKKNEYQKDVLFHIFDKLPLPEQQKVQIEIGERLEKNKTNNEKSKSSEPSGLIPRLWRWICSLFG